VSGGYRGRSHQSYGTRRSTLSFTRVCVMRPAFAKYITWHTVYLSCVTVLVLYICVLFVCEAGDRPRIVNTGGSETVVDAGHDVQFTCEAYGTPRPFILWYKDQNILDHAQSRSFLPSIIIPFLLATLSTFDYVDSRWFSAYPVTEGDLIFLSQFPQKIFYVVMSITIRKWHLKVVLKQCKTQ